MSARLIWHKPDEVRFRWLRLRWQRCMYIWNQDTMSWYRCWC
jgi:hypothetical protein